MAKNELITVFCFDQEIGRLGFDENKLKSSFQFNEAFLTKKDFSNLFPQTGILKRVPQTQTFSKYNNDTFRGLPPFFADSLPDMFGNIIFKKWLEINDNNFSQLSVIEQLAYVGNRGMGALEYRPNHVLPSTTTIDLSEIIIVLNEVLKTKNDLRASSLDHESLLNIFKIGSSAGGARPKVLISENKETGTIIPGDLTYAADHNHYLVKLSIDEALGFSREVIEYCYYLTAKHLGINMMDSKLIHQKHFATLRFDRRNGQKKHVLTATGLTGWDFQSPKDSSYENLFKLALFLNIPHAEMEELFRRMIFNLVFCNTDDHLKNHAFIYDEQHDRWNLSPAYDLTYSLNPLMKYTKSLRALSINDKRVNIQKEDVLELADNYTIRNFKNIILEIQEGIDFLKKKMEEFKLPNEITKHIMKDITRLL